jgi:tRNA nucleotidyltransferase/poly(A) polymerase
MKIFEVGGSVRDSFLGVKTKDMDYSVEASSWEEMRTWVHKNTEKVFLEKPEFFTIRAMWNKGPCDFVLCRKEGAYSDFRHPEKVENGTILDDLARRDFTVNAIAKDMGTGQIIDPFDGRSDIEKKIIRCVGGTDRLFEDPLRMLRAIRFSITKGFDIDDEIFSIWSGFFPTSPDNKKTKELVEKFKASVSNERTREELLRCFEFSTIKTLRTLGFADPSWTDAIFGDGLWLRPTLEA